MNVRYALTSLLAAVLLFAHVNANAAGSCSFVGPTTVDSTPSTDVLQVLFSCTADVADGSFPAYDVPEIKGGLLTGIQVLNGATDLSTGGVLNFIVARKYALTTLNLMGTGGTGITLTNDQAIMTPENTALNSYLADFVGPVTFQITGNVVNSANPSGAIMFRVEKRR